MVAAPRADQRKADMTRSWLLPAAMAASMALLPAVIVGGGSQAASAQASTQTSPLATEPLPAQGPGQAVTGAAVSGSAPGPGAPGMPSPGPAAPSTLDASQAQQGKLLKPGAGADDMNAASGDQPDSQPK
jgi:hypothetical protein